MFYACIKYKFTLQNLTFSPKQAIFSDCNTLYIYQKGKAENIKGVKHGKSTNFNARGFLGQN